MKTTLALALLLAVTGCKHYSETVTCIDKISTFDRYGEGKFHTIFKDSTGKIYNIGGEKEFYSIMVGQSKVVPMSCIFCKSH